jgi:hypothetical protein
MHPEFRRLPSVQDRLDDIRRQQREHQDLPEIAPIQLLTRCQVGDGPVAAVSIDATTPRCGTVAACSKTK